MKKKVVSSFDFIRVISTMGIVIYHYCCHLNDKRFLPLYAHANGSWGSTLVTVFFMLSGALLYYHYSESLNIFTLKYYYYKRWKSIFPMYYLAYLFLEVLYQIKYGLFYRGNPLGYIFTLVGLDGYLSSVLPSHLVTYILGEWFTGAIVILYLLFPFILWSTKKHPTLTTLSVFLLYILTFEVPIINPHPYWSIPSCLLSFFLGMLFIRLRYISRSRLFISGCMFTTFLLCAVKMPLSENIGDHLVGVMLFITLDSFGTFLMSKRLPNIIFTRLSSISFAIFLVHHFVIIMLLGHWQPVGIVQVIVFLLLNLFIILPTAYILFTACSIIMKRIEPLLLRKLKLSSTR